MPADEFIRYVGCNFLEVEHTALLRQFLLFKTDDGLDEKLLLRADGTSVYMTQDLGTAIMRHEEFNPGRMIYVVGNEQNYHFEVLKKVLKKKKFTQTPLCTAQ